MNVKNNSCCSRSNFDKSARALLAALRSFTVSEEDKFGKKNVGGDCSDSETVASAKSLSPATTFDLCRWDIKNIGEFNCDPNNCGFVYLTHPAVELITFMPSETDNDELICASSKSFVIDGENDELFEDNSILNDDQSTVNINPESYVWNKKDESESKINTLWKFSIVYSNLYEVPVLYFSVQDFATGNQVGRRKLLDIFRQNHNMPLFSISNDRPTDTWEFLSQDEHPVSGIPSYFLHPCHSADWIQSLMTISVADAEDTTTDQCRRNNIAAAYSGLLLWVWMSMTFPAVGFPIPHLFFQRIKNDILQQCLRK